MELEHRFEVPVGIDQAWPSLLDMSRVAECFPGATLSSADGDTYTGSVKVKLGPIQLTYQGKARIVEADESAHRAVIEASGSASRSASTASMTVTATATAVDADRTAVDMATSLTITGRPAQFGRGVMVEVGNKILGQFADCLSATLATPAAPPAVTGSPATGAAGTGTAGTGAPGGIPADSGAGADAGAAAGADGGAAPDADPGGADAGGGAAAGRADRSAGDAAGRAATAAAAATGSGPAVTAPIDPAPAGAGPGHAAAYTRSPEPIDLLEHARSSIVKRVVPLIAAVILLIVLRAILKGRRRLDGATG